MGYALVGSLGAVSSSLSPSFGQATTAGNLLVCWLSCNSSSGTPPFTTSSPGWVIGSQFGTGFVWAGIAYKDNCGAGESAPTFGPVGTSAPFSQLGEFSGGATSSAVDQTGDGGSSGGSNQVATCPAADGQGGDLIIGVVYWNGGSSAPTITTALADSSGASVTAHATNNAGANGVLYDFVWGVAGGVTGGGGDTLTATLSQFSGGTSGIVSFKPAAAAATPAPVPALLMPPGLNSPAAWQRPRYVRLGQVTTIAGSGGVVLPKPSLSGTGALSPRTVLPASPLLPPGLNSPAAWQFPRYPRLGQVMTIAGSGGVVLPKPSLSGQGTLGLPVALRPLMPPGLSSPAAWQFPYRRPGQVTTIAGSGGVILPKPSLGGQGALAVPSALPASPLMPPGLASPAAWQRPRYPRLGQTVTIAGSGGVALPKPSLSASGLVTVSGIARPPLLPPGLNSPAAWQFPRYPRLGQTVTAGTVTGSGGVRLPKPSLAAAAPVLMTGTAGQGGWWQLHGIITAAAQEREFWDSQAPMACPRCGEPLRPAPSSDSGSAVESYCQYDGWRYPGDWDASTMSGM